MCAEKENDNCCPTLDTTIENWWTEINNFTQKKNYLRKEETLMYYKIMEVQRECPDLEAYFTRDTKFDVKKEVPVTEEAVA